MNMENRYLVQTPYGIPTYIGARINVGNIIKYEKNLVGYTNLSL